MSNNQKPKTRRRKSAKYKSKMVIELLRGTPAEEIARREELAVFELEEWKEQFVNHGRHGFKKDPEKSKLSEAERIIGRLSMEIELLKKKIAFNQNHLEK